MRIRNMENCVVSIVFLQMWYGECGVGVTCATTVCMTLCVSVVLNASMYVSQVINKGGITYKNTPWHRECFMCTQCNKQLAGEKFTSKDEKPYCAECFGELFAKKCCRCTKPITGTMVHS